MRNHFTQDGFEFRRKQIKAQQEKVRAIGKEAGQEAGANCDWHDNFGYEDAKRRLEMESEILRKMMEETSDVQIVNVEEQNDAVAIGVTVELLMNGGEKVFTIGAFGESDPTNGLISYNTPLGRQLLKMEAGDVKNITVGGNSTDIEVRKIYPPSYRYHSLIAQLVDSG
jgi:transcription elongation GreA/GreB family factor